MPKKAKAEREQERWNAEMRAWEKFRPKLAVLESYIDAKQLAAQSPPPDSPGRNYYSNLAFFLQEFVVPGGSSQEERTLYLRFIQRLDSAGALKAGVGAEVEKRLRRSVEE